MQENIRWGVRYLRVYEKKNIKMKNKYIYIYIKIYVFYERENELMSLNQQLRQPNTK